MCSLIIIIYFQDLEDVGDVYQDESNMAAMLLYKHGHSDEYKMVRHESYVSTAYKPVPGLRIFPRCLSSSHHCRHYTLHVTE